MCQVGRHACRFFGMDTPDGTAAGAFRSSGRYSALNVCSWSLVRAAAHPAMIGPARLVDNKRAGGFAAAGELCLGSKQCRFVTAASCCPRAPVCMLRKRVGLLHAFWAPLHR